METNYYAISKKSTHSKPLHIGKSSAGWKFLFYKVKDYENYFTYKTIYTYENLIFLSIISMLKDIGFLKMSFVKRRYKMKPLFPNLELIEHKATELALLDDRLSSPPEFDLITFPQTWDSTCIGFDLTSDGLPACGGSAMTKEYTTVAHELKTDVYYIFFGGRPCYKVTEAGKNFFSDLNSQNMASLSKAKNRYIDEKDTSNEQLFTSISNLRDDIDELHSLLSYEFYSDMRDKIDTIESLILEVVER